MLATGLLARDVGLMSGQTQTMLLHLVALVLVSGFAFVTSYLLYWVTDRLITLRVPIEHEVVGLDISQHKEFLEIDPFRQFGGVPTHTRERVGSAARPGPDSGRPRPPTAGASTGVFGSTATSRQAICAPEGRPRLKCGRSRICGRSLCPGSGRAVVIRRLVRSAADLWVQASLDQR